MATTAEQPANGLGPISAGTAYPLPDFQRRAGLSAWGFRQAKREGLKVRTVGRRKYVTGDDWISFLNQQSAT